MTVDDLSGEGSLFSLRAPAAQVQHLVDLVGYLKIMPDVGRRYCGPKRSWGSSWE